MSNNRGMEIESLDFDSDALWLSLFGWRLIKQASKKIPHEKLITINIKKEDLRLNRGSYEWVNEIASRVFNWFVEFDTEEYTSEKEEDIERAMDDIGYKEYHEDICYMYYIDNELQDNLECGVCRQCDNCRMLFKDYLRQFRMCKKTIVLDERIDITKIYNWQIECVPNLITDDFVRENVVHKVYIDEFANEIIIEYIDDGSGYFGCTKDELINDNLETVQNIISMIK